MKENNLNKIYGYQNEKDELMRIKSWLNNKKMLSNKKLMLPKGILFYGPTGCGKTLLLREYAASFDAPKYVIDGKSKNISDEIVNVFNKARENPFALILIDEIDLLIGQNSLVERTLQQELDGINKRGAILVLATTNNLDDINRALLRQGRMDRHMSIDYPDEQSRLELFKNFLKDLNIKTNNIDLKHIAKSSSCDGATIKAICNDAYLRCGSNINTEDIEKSYNRIFKLEYSDKITYKDFRKAIHEAGHALMVFNFKDNWQFNNSKFSGSTADTEYYANNEQQSSIKKREESIMIAMGGYIAEEIYFGHHEVGSYNDYVTVYDQCQRLIERVCVDGIENAILPYHNNDTRYETPEKRSNNEKLTHKSIQKYEKYVRKFIKHNKEKIETFAKTMYENGSVNCKTAKEIFIE